MRWMFGLLLTAAACSQEASMLAELGEDVALDADEDLASSVYFDVHPTQLLDANNDIRVLPQTFGPFGIRTSSLGMGTVELDAPTTLSGSVVASVVTPQAAGAELPFEKGPVSATLSLTQSERTVQNYSATTDEFGAFSTLLLADGYALVVIPDNPEIPVAVRQETIGGSGGDLDLELGSGVAIWGQVRYPSLPSADPFRVHVVYEDGVRSSTALTDEDGYYVIRVEADSVPFVVVCEGRDDGRDPILVSDVVDLSQTDTAVLPEYASEQVDFDYPAYRAAAASGRVLDESGDPVEDVEVRFTSVALDGYEAQAGSIQIVRITDASGNFDISLPAGDYTVEFMPQGGRSPKVSNATVSGNSSLGSITLDGLREVSGTVRDPQGSPVNSAQVTCTELGFGGRSWTTFTNKKGVYGVEVSATPLACVVTPPDTSVLAMTRTEVSGESLEGALDLEVVSGQQATGTLEMNGEPETFAVVEIRDGHGRLLGTAVTDESGFFEVRVDLQQVDSEDTGQTN